MTLERFQQLASSIPDGKTGIVPVWKDCLLDIDTPVSAFAKLKRGPFAFLLESAPAGGETWSRYTFMGTEPRSAWRLKDGVVEDWTAEQGWHNPRKPADPLADLNSLISSAEPVEVPELGAFWSGAVGFFSYDVVRFIEDLPNAPPVPKSREGVPDAVFVFTSALVIIDNLKSQARIVVGIPVHNGSTDLREAYAKAEVEIQRIFERLQSPSQLKPLVLNKEAEAATGKSNYNREKFLGDVEKIKEYIRAGDIFQALISRRIEIPHDFSSDSLYRALRAINPSPYMYHLILDGMELVGSSPELQVRVADNRAIVRPIAGTRRRDGILDDEALAADLLADEKERAEHIMLVDLGRNDVGRIAKFGSVEVSDLMHIEKFSHVMHIVTNVEAEMEDGRDAMDAFRATFPAGTMTGAPKVRAMEIIDEMEPERRGPYTGAVGYIAAGGQRMDMAITIRTCVIANGVAAVQAGAGIVADSVAEKEWEETENKARAMLTAIGQVRS